MNQEKNNILNQTDATKAYIKTIKDKLIDNQACNLFKDLKWIELEGISQDKSDLFPIVFTGKGNKVLLLHGFDSCFLEYRRLTPFLKNNNKLIIPDLFGFGFSPRTSGNKYGFKYLMKHLNSVLNYVSGKRPVGLIGASMGGALALELARQNPRKVNKLLLLSPAGLAGKNQKIPWPLNHFGAYFLGQPFVRRALCRQAFADPTNSVGPAEEEIASIHLRVPGWQSSLAEFAAEEKSYQEELTRSHQASLTSTRIKPASEPELFELEPLLKLIMLTRDCKSTLLLYKSLKNKHPVLLLRLDQLRIL